VSHFAQATSPRMYSALPERVRIVPNALRTAGRISLQL
jgi:hypothetical protein